MTVLQVAIGFGAFLCGVRAIGYWVMLQLGGAGPSERGGIALAVCGSALLFVVLSSAAAYLRERASGARAVAGRALFLTGAHGLPAIALFTAASKGAVLRMPEVTGLAILFVCLVCVFRSPVPRHNA